ncbi:MAG: hypothetical protein P4L53_08990 [Candidatus Obscuribacterales bacterium]|nr:hypothetical protein [Candidatus Obscuribacterales bacterium]
MPLFLAVNRKSKAMILTLVSNTGSALATPLAAAKQTSQVSAVRSAQGILPWGPHEDLKDTDRLFRLFRWACNQESLDFAAKPRSKRVFAEILMPTQLGVSRELLVELVGLLQQSNYDADAPEPKFGAPQKLLLRSKSASSG